MSEIASPDKGEGYIDNPTDKVTSISIAETSGIVKRYRPPAVTGGQPDPDAGPGIASQTSNSVAQASRGSGVSSLEPGYQRAAGVSGASSGRSVQAGPGDEVVGGERSVSKPQLRPAIATRPELASDTSPLPADEINKLLAEQTHQTTGHASPAKSPTLPLEVNGRPGEGSLIHVDGADLTITSNPDSFTSPPESAQPLATSPIDERKWVAGLPRSCETCQQFQRNPDGRTGICCNSHAFSSPTVVECQQLACRSSVGIWWLPSDDYWLERADVSHHTRPTPYLDAVLAEVRSGSR